MMLWLIMACSVKSGVAVLQMDQMYKDMDTPKNRSAQFEWSMAEEYRLKAKEEYSTSQFQDAEMLAKEAITWMNKAKDLAQVSENGDAQ